LGEVLTLPVPETLHATYAVAFTVPFADPLVLAREQVTRRVRPPLRDLALRLLDGPLLTLDLRPAEEFPPLPGDLLTAYGADPRDLADLGSASRLLVVRAAYRPGWPPAHEWAARAIAGAIGVALSAPVVDVFTPRILPRAQLDRSLPGPDGDMRLTDWMLLPHNAGPDGLWFVTRGLARFGLPELQTENVPPALLEPWGSLLNGVARRVLELWLAALTPGERPVLVELPQIVSVGLRDIAAAHGDHDPLRREVAVRLDLDSGDTTSAPVLTVTAPSERPYALESLCAALFNSHHDVA
jgi:hypothetical protein